MRKYTGENFGKYLQQIEFTATVTLCAGCNEQRSLSPTFFPNRQSEGVAYARKSLI